MFKMTILAKSIYRFKTFPIKLPMEFFTELEQKKNLKICMETQKTRIAKAILRKKEDQEESGSLASDYTTKLQSSKQYGTITKTEI